MVSTLEDQMILEHATVLLADDDENDVLLMQRAFQKARLANPLQIVRNGEQAVAYLEGTGCYADREKFPLPCLVLLDLKMPKKNGFDVLQWIRTTPAVHRILVVILTSSSETPDINRGYDLGANSYLVKPPDIDALHEMLRTVQGYWLFLNQMPELPGEAITT
ncbi:MAG: response regulator receiver protein [Verrucomicrobiales bacterium]|nr:response regulator receiver protein [Verrucomicrobiales bacterium]